MQTDITFQLEGGPWDGQTISTNSPCEVTADFARAMFLFSQGAPVGGSIPLAAPAAEEEDASTSDGDTGERATANAPAPRTHTYAIRKRSESQGVVTIKAVHSGFAS